MGEVEGEIKRKKNAFYLSSPCGQANQTGKK